MSHKRKFRFALTNILFILIIDINSEPSPRENALKMVFMKYC